VGEVWGGDSGVSLLRCKKIGGIMTPGIFLSLSGQDVDFAEEVARNLPRGLARIYTKSFENGEALLTEMEKGIGQSQMFVFLASRASLTSCWVGFELDQARLRNISDKMLILAFPIEEGIRSSDFPEWMRQNWIGPNIWGPKDIGRYVQEKLFSEHFSGTLLYQRVLGRGGLRDKVTREMLSLTAETGETPNIFIFPGTVQIGRRTFAKYFMKEALAALPYLVVGPEINLPQFADLADIYRSLLDSASRAAAVDMLEASLAAFMALPQDQQVDEVVTLMEYFGDLGQAVFINTGSGFFEESGNPKPWIGTLFDQLRGNRSVVLCMISNRRFRDEFIAHYPNVLQSYVPAMEKEDISALITSTCAIYDLKPFEFSKFIVSAIGGHPGIAKASVRLVANQGLDIIERNPFPIFSLQDFILAHNIDDANLSAIQKEILLILSWVPSLGGRIIEEVILGRHENSEDEFISSIEEMLLSCLIVAHNDDYAISAELREIFRRRFGFGADDLLENFAQILSKEWQESKARGDVNTGLIDAFVFMHAIAGKALPDEFKHLLLPSTLEEIVRVRYAQGRDDRSALEKVVEWGSVATDIPMDETVREAILSIVAQSLIRLRKYPEAEKLISELGEKGYRSVPFLRGFMLRRRGRFNEAIGPLREAIRTGKNLRYSVQELATVLHTIGDYRALDELVSEHKSLIESSAVLLDFKIGLLISASDFGVAESAIAHLATLPQDDGRAATRSAQIESQRDGRHKFAFQTMDALVRQGIGDQLRVRRWRGLFAAYAGEEETARRDIEFLNSKNGQEATAQRLRVHLAIAEGHGDLAQAELDKLEGDSLQKRVLQARVLDLRSENKNLGLAVREKLKSDAAAIRANSFGEAIDV